MAKNRSKIPVYRGGFKAEHAERLLWRAGVGPRPGEAQRLAKKGMRKAVLSLTRPRGLDKLVGPPPTTEENQPLAPTDAWGHDHLWWFDRMVRTSQPFKERMTLIWHDWFATSNDGVGDQALMIKQNQLFRHHFLGSFRKLLLEVTKDPAMLIWLSGNENTKDSPNENYARELMELFTLGATARYTEQDVREQARALTGWRAEWSNGGYGRFHFDEREHDTSIKRVFRKRGAFDWKDSCKLCLEHRDHADYLVRKLWSYFIPTKPPAATVAGLKRLYIDRKYAVKPVVEAILMHPAFYNGPRMVKPPAVHFAGLLRARNAGIGSESWVWISDMAGQRLFYPPNVAGWRDDTWLDTGTFRGRWVGAGEAASREALDPGDDALVAAWDPNETPASAVAAALAYWGNPTISNATMAQLNAFSAQCDALANREWKKVTYRIMRQNALRVLIATSPDMQAS